MTSTPKRPTDLPQPASSVPRAPEGSRFGEFEVSRIGLRYRVVQRCCDGYVRDTFTGRFFRWITAGRIAQALNMALNAPSPNERRIINGRWRIPGTVVRLVVQPELSSDPVEGDKFCISAGTTPWYRSGPFLKW